jgi:hypothetical protein
MLASSDSALFAVAVWYVVRWECGAKWAGIAGATAVWGGPIELEFWGATGSAADWMVVSVVVIDLTDAGGEEKVLLWSPSVLAAVAEVPAPEGAWSDTAVSAVVARVGARDFGCPLAALSLETEVECLLMLWDREECRDLWDEIGVVKGRPFDSALLLNVPDRYGLFLEILGLRYFWVKGIAFFCFCARPESVWEYLRFARRFIQFENGRRRAWRSCERLVLSAQEVNQWVSHLVVTHHLIAKDLRWTPYLRCVKVETFTCSWQTALFHRDRGWWYGNATPS